MTGHTSAAEDGAFTANWARLVEKNHYRQCEPRGGAVQDCRLAVSSARWILKEREKNDHAHMSKPNR
jgi:hypothetical protein